MNCFFVKYNELFLKKSYFWLHDEEIKFLTNTSDFTKEEQWSWFSSLEKKSDYIIFGIMVDNEPIGVCGLKNITNASGEYWGYIGEKDYWGRGIGKKMIQFIIGEAMNHKLSILYLKVIAQNVRAIDLYRKFGFVVNSEKSNNELFLFEKTLI